MPVPFANKAAAALALATVAAGPPAAVPNLRFDRAFSVADAPAASHASVLYRAHDGLHRLEITREGERRLRRDTDGRLVTVATHRPGEAGYRLDLFDRARRIHTVVDRDSLYRVGRFTDWPDLAHGLRHPAGAYRLRATGAVRSPVAPVADCRWFALEQDGRRSTICWSAREALPLVVLDDSGQPVWRVTGVDHRPAPARMFAPDAAGYVLADASTDISGD